MPSQHLAAVQKLFQEYYIQPLMYWAKAMKFRVQAEPQDEQILLDAGYHWDENTQAYMGGKMGQYFIALPGNQFIWMWGGIGKHIKNIDKLNLWLSGRGVDFLHKLIALSKAAGGLQANPELDLDDTDKLIHKLTAQAGASKELPADVMIDLGQQAQKDNNEKLLNFLKTMTPISEITIKRSQLNELIRHIIGGVLAEAATVKAKDPDLNKAKRIAMKVWGKGLKLDKTNKQDDKKIYWFEKDGNLLHGVAKSGRTGAWKVFHHKTRNWYVIDQYPKDVPVEPVAEPMTPDKLATTLWGDKQWSVWNQRKSSTGQVYMLKTGTGPAEKRFLWNNNGQWLAMDPAEHKWQLVNDINPTENVEEMTGTGAVAGFSTPFAFKKTKGMEEEAEEKINEAILSEEELDEESSSTAAGVYNIPAAFSKQGGSKKGMDVSQHMGYELTPIGKKEMSRTADKLYEGVKQKILETLNTRQTVNVSDIIRLVPQEQRVEADDAMSEWFDGHNIRWVSLTPGKSMNFDALPDAVKLVLQKEMGNHPSKDHFGIVYDY